MDWTASKMVPAVFDLIFPASQEHRLRPWVAICMVKQKQKRCLEAKQENYSMSSIKTFAIAAALVVGAASVAMAQGSGTSASPSTASEASGGGGTHKDAPRTGSASSDQKIFNNQNGYSGGKQ